MIKWDDSSGGSVALSGCTFGSSGISISLCKCIPLRLLPLGRIFQPFIHFLIHQPGSEALHLSLFATNNWASLHHKMQKIGRIAWETVRPTCQIFLGSLWTKRDAAWSEYATCVVDPAITIKTSFPLEKRSDLRSSDWRWRGPSRLVEKVLKLAIRT